MENSKRPRNKMENQIQHILKEGPACWLNVLCWYVHFHSACLLSLSFLRHIQSFLVASAGFLSLWCRVYWNVYKNNAIPTAKDWQITICNISSLNYYFKWLFKMKVLWCIYAMALSLCVYFQTIDWMCRIHYSVNSVIGSWISVPSSNATETIVRQSL